jgi:hypothetical protein
VGGLATMPDEAAAHIARLYQDWGRSQEVEP